jgi:hypothetical protein
VTRTIAVALAAFGLMGGVANAWTSGYVSDPLEGRVGPSATVRGTVTAYTRHSSDQSSAASLRVYCEKNSTTVLFESAGHSYYARPSLRYKIDDQPIRNSSITQSLDNHAAGWWSGSGIAFIKSLYKAAARRSREALARNARALAEHSRTRAQPRAARLQKGGRVMVTTHRPASSCWPCVCCGRTAVTCTS